MPASRLRFRTELHAMPASTTSHGAINPASELLRANVPAGRSLARRSSKSFRSGESGGNHRPASRNARSGLAWYTASVCGIS